MANSDWPEKFKAAFEITQPAAKEIFDRLLLIRSELRNYVAHGAFGKHGEAFQFHSGAGAVPLLLPHAAAKRKFRFESGLAFNSVAALGVLDEFETFLWDGDRAPAKIYIESELPFILTMVADGSYTAAMRSEESMQKLATELSHRFDQSANMDW